MSEETTQNLGRDGGDRLEQIMAAVTRISGNVDLLRTDFNAHRQEFLQDKEARSRDTKPLNQTLVEIREDVAGVRTDISGLRDELSEVKRLVKRVETTVTGMAGDVFYVKGSVEEHERRLNEISST